MAVVVDKYTDDYTSQYWQDYTQTFSGSVKFQIVLGSRSGAEDIARNFAADKSVLHASVYTGQHELLATAGNNPGCREDKADFTHPFNIETYAFWCFYAPVYQQTHYLGYVELIVSKTDLKAVLWRLFVTGGLIILVFSAVILLLIRRFSGLFTSTLVDMSVVLKKVSQGVRGERVSFSGAVDFDMMRDVINEMLTEIELNEQALAQKVADRTRELEIALDNRQSAYAYKTQIMGLTSHEMKTPLHAVNLNLQLALEELSEGVGYDGVRALLAKALIRADDLKEIIENILLQSR